ncbi:MAG: hypothetical protein A2V67_20310 [Deltaproteobacteria bacterium RBG_13_61_14]|nr:MAG: hypothetical protein A2V67_20310 [Deltaproteobacteria bacterium RBG_13_61_14]
MGKIVSINLSRKKGTIKQPVAKAELVAGLGIAGDAHAAAGNRQVSLLMQESIEKQKRRMEKNPGEKVKLKPGVFAENLTTAGIDLLALRLGDELKLGNGLRLRVSKIGKECHTRCAISDRAGDCVMPREGIFCEVAIGGSVRVGDRIEQAERHA